MSTTATIVGNGKYTYEVREDWAKLPDGWTMPAAAVTVDSQDRVYCFNRTPDHPVVVFDRDGNYLHSWGAGVFAFPHTIRADEHDNLWIVDRDHGQMFYFTADGKLLRTIGTKGFRSDTGVDPSENGSTAYRSVKRGGAPFNLPAGRLRRHGLPLRPQHLARLPRGSLRRAPADRKRGLARPARGEAHARYGDRKGGIAPSDAPLSLSLPCRCLPPGQDPAGEGGA